MTFGEILKELQQGRVVRRKSWREELVVFMQIPANIPCSRTWHMQSVPYDMKVLCKQCDLEINYKDQFIIYDISDQSATYVVFDGEDVNSTDWEVINPISYDPHGNLR